MANFRHVSSCDRNLFARMTIVASDDAIKIRIEGTEGAQELVLEKSSESNHRLFEWASMIGEVALLEQMEDGICMPLEDDFKRLGMDRELVESLRNRAENSEMMLRRLISKIKSGKVTDELLTQATTLACKHSSPLR
ncbi:MAG: hypothetical protein RSD49_18005 [Hafnia sp.]